jgi:hypothetical protein
MFNSKVPGTMTQMTHIHPFEDLSCRWTGQDQFKLIEISQEIDDNDLLPHSSRIYCQHIHEVAQLVRLLSIVVQTRRSSGVDPVC